MNQKITNQELDVFGNLELLARQVVEGFITGLHKSPFHGFSVEFAEHRLYNSGESTRHLDWKIYGKTGKLFVKRYEEETNLRCQLIIDGSSSMYFPEKGLNKMRFSVYAAAALMHLMKRQRDAFGLTVLSDHIDFQSETKSSSSHYFYLISELEKLLQAPAEQKQTSLAQSLDLLAEKLHRRSMVVIFSDMLQTSGDEEALYKSLQHLKFNKHEVILFHVQDKALEVDFDFANRPYLFIDPETGQQLKLNPNEVKDAYIQAQRDFKTKLKARCDQYKIDFIEVDSGLDFNQVLAPYLVKRGKLY
ncbi:MAG: DUF58 domain-containing protein [Bacteroidetes bacterium]|nr:MAG: DUF58 domain-containing protein [Bacteroidota bacterium]